MKDKERGRDKDRGSSRPLAGSLMQNSIPRLGSHPEPKANAQPLSYPGIPKGFCFHSVVSSFPNFFSHYKNKLVNKEKYSKPIEIIFKQK